MTQNLPFDTCHQTSARQVCTFEHSQDAAFRLASHLANNTLMATDIMLRVLSKPVGNGTSAQAVLVTTLCNETAKKQRNDRVVVMKYGEKW